MSIATTTPTATPIERDDQAQVWAELYLRSAGIPARFRDCMLETYRTPCAGTAAAHAQVARWVADYGTQPLQPGLVLCGPTGVGKTHLGIAALRGAAKAQARRGHNGRCLYLGFSDLLAGLRESFDAGGDSAGRDLKAEALTTPLLLLDDVGSQRATDFVQGLLYEIVNRRYNDGLPLILTTNLIFWPADPARDRLRDYCGPRVWSRLCEMCAGVAILTRTDQRVAGRR